MPEENSKQKYYGTITELQEIRKSIKYIATSYDKLAEQLKNTDISSIAKRLELKFEFTVQSVIREALEDFTENPNVNSEKALLYHQLHSLQKQWNYATSQQEKDRIRGLINSIMYELNNY